MMIIAIDTSIVWPGIAVSLNGKLEIVTCLNIPKWVKDGKKKVELTDLQRYRLQIAGINQLLQYHRRWDVDHALIVVEIPGYREVDKNRFTIQLLQKTAGWISGYYCGKGHNVVEVLPQHWKGNFPKDKTRYLIDTLYPNIKPGLSHISEDNQHNAYDAAGIWHWFYSNPEFFHLTRPQTNPA